MPARLASSISSDLAPSMRSSRLRRARSLTSARFCISARPASVLTQITRMFPFPSGTRPRHNHEMYQHALRRCVLEALRFVAQFTAQDLADRRLGQVVPELDDLRPLVTGEIGLAVGAHRRLRDARILPDDDELDRLAGLGVGDADRGALEDPRHLRDDILDLVRVDVEAADQDHVLLAVDYPEVAALIDDADVTAA